MACPPWQGAINPLLPLIFESARARALSLSLFLSLLVLFLEVAVVGCRCCLMHVVCCTHQLLALLSCFRFSSNTSFAIYTANRMSPLPNAPLSQNLEEAGAGGRLPLKMPIIYLSRLRD